MLGEFVAIGTANGAGVPGTSCGDDYDPGWTVFVDGEKNGVYFCEDFVQDEYGFGANPSFVIRFKDCPFVGNRWVLEFGGDRRSCRSATVNGASRVIAMIETTGGGTTDRNIDARWTEMERHNVGGFWAAMNVNILPSPDPNYDVDLLTTFSFDTYLPPLN